MKPAKITLGLFIITILTTINSFAQEFTLTTSAANVIASRATIDNPALNGNPKAIIIATPIAGTETLNPHPIGAWYYNNKWNIFNTDHFNMPIGAKYTVQYFPQPDADHFLHVITGNSATVSRSYLDYSILNNNPNIQFKILQNHAPDHRAFYLNPSEAKAEYDASVGKWFIENVNRTPLHPNTAYNIAIASGGTGNQPSDNPTQPFNGSAGGDLSGTYPNPTVQKILGRNLSSTVPKVGQTLKWNGTEWIPTEDNVTGSTPANSAPVPQIQTFFNRSSEKSPQIGFGNTHIVTELSHSIVLAKKSRLVISAAINIDGPTCELVCDGTQGVFSVRINGSSKFSLRVAAPQNSLGSATISNFMIDLNPGTHNIQFIVTHSPPSSAIVIFGGGYSSVMVIPLE